MNDKQFIKTLKNIKEYCEETSCYQCKFHSSLCSFGCKLQHFGQEIWATPNLWNIEEIERIIND